MPGHPGGGCMPGHPGGACAADALGHPGGAPHGEPHISLQLTPLAAKLDKMLAWENPRCSTFRRPMKIHRASGSASTTPI
jgi:hypothetical protein